MLSGEDGVLVTGAREAQAEQTAAQRGLTRCVYCSGFPSLLQSQAVQFAAFRLPWGGFCDSSPLPGPLRSPGIHPALGRMGRQEEPWAGFSCVHLLQAPNFLPLTLSAAQDGLLAAAAVVGGRSGLLVEQPSSGSGSAAARSWQPKPAVWCTGPASVFSPKL